VYHKRGKNERRRGGRNHRQNAENKREIVQGFSQKLANFPLIPVSNPEKWF
jgi:hypothetical protein